MATAQIPIQPRVVYTMPSGSASLPSTGTESASGQRNVTVWKDGKSYMKVNVVVNGVMYKILVPYEVNERPFTMQYTTRRGKVARFKAMPQTTVLLKPPAQQTARPPAPAPRIVSVIPGGQPLSGPFTLVRQPPSMLARVGVRTQAVPSNVNDFDNEEVTEGVDDAYMFDEGGIEEYEAMLLDDANSGSTQDGSGEHGVSVDTTPLSPNADTVTTTGNNVENPCVVTTSATANTPIISTVSSENTPIAKTTTKETHSTTTDVRVGNDSQELVDQNKSTETTTNISSQKDDEANKTGSTATEKGKRVTVRDLLQNTGVSALLPNVDGETTDDASEDGTRIQNNEEEEECRILSDPPSSSESDSDSSSCLLYRGRRKGRNRKHRKGPRSKHRRRDSDYVPNLASVNWKNLSLSVKTRGTTDKSFKEMNPGVKFPPNVQLKPCSVMLHRLPSKYTSPYDPAYTATKLPNNKQKGDTDLFSFMRKRRKVAKKHTDGSLKKKIKMRKQNLSEKPKESSGSTVVTSVCSTTSVTTTHSLSTAGSRPVLTPVTGQNLSQQPRMSLVTTINSLTSSQSRVSPSVSVPLSIAPAVSNTASTVSTSHPVASAGNSGNKYVLIKTNSGNFLVPFDSPLVTQAKNLSSAASAAVNVITNTTATAGPVVNGMAATNSVARMPTLTAASGAPVLPQPIRMPYLRPPVVAAGPPTKDRATPAGEGAAKEDVQEKQPTETVMEERIRRLKEMLRQKEEEVEIFRKKRSQDTNKT